MTSNKLNIILFSLTLLSSPLWALSTDKEQPLEVEADNFHLDEAKQTTIYSGNVIITQGTMELLADKVTMYSLEGKTEKMIAIGKIVKFKQQPDGDQGIIHGEAKRFEYLVNKDVLVLTNKATLLQDGNTFASDRIVYDSKRSIVKAGDQKTGAKRVKIILQPAKSP